MQTILGAGGAIATDLARELHKYTPKVRLVSRDPQPANGTDEVMTADLTKAAEADKAVAGSEVVYLVVGLAYSTQVWQKQWPVLMQNVIRACEKHRAKLVFFDNIYMYDPEHMHHLTEETPVKPVSRKGLVRAQIAQMLLDEVQKGNLTALIARAADFIGPKNSMLVETVYKNLKKGGKAIWMSDAGKVHTFTFTPDAARATALLGNTPGAYNQIWHLPTDRTPRTGRQWVQLFARELNVEPKLTVLPRWLISLLGLFMPILRESKEMLYQYDRDYLFDSSKFEKSFGMKPTPAEEAVKQVVGMMKQ